MGPSDYSEKIRPLFFKSGNHIPNTIAALGLAGEAAEVTALFEEYGAKLQAAPEQLEAVTDEFTKKLILELGDTLWYVAAILDSFGLDCSEIDDQLSDYEAIDTLLAQLAGFNPARLCASLSMHAGAACDRIKKAEWHGKDLDLDDLIADLSNVSVVISEIGLRIKAGMGEICQANVEKLEKRYPNGFVEGGGVR